MKELMIFVDFVKDMGFIGILIVLAIPALRSKLGFDNGNDKKNSEEHEKLWDAIADVRDNHIHQIKDCLLNVRTDVAWIKGRLDQ